MHRSPRRVRILQSRHSIRECQRPQGISFDFILIPTKIRRKLEADELARLRATFTDAPDDDLRRSAADGPRYKALGNSWAGNCADWIGERIQLMEASLSWSAYRHHIEW